MYANKGRHTYIHDIRQLSNPASATKTEALEKQISKKPNILQLLQGIHEYLNEKRIRQKID